jgi:hypothetical protein
MSESDEKAKVYKNPSFDENPSFDKNAENVRFEYSRAFQMKFLSGLVGAVLAELVAKILSGQVPAEWDGVELRRWAADRFEEAAYIKMDRKRLRAYHNTRIVNNL